MWEFDNEKLKRFDGRGIVRIMFDLEYICENAGKKITYTWYDADRKKTMKQSEVILPIPQMKRIMKFICQNCHDDDILDQLQEYLKTNSSKCFEAFRSYRK